MTISTDQPSLSREQSYIWGVIQYLASQGDWQLILQGALFPEPVVFRAGQDGRGTILRFMEVSPGTSMIENLESSYHTGLRLLEAQPLRGLTIIQVYLLQSIPNQSLEKQLVLQERHHAAPDLSVFSAWIHIDNRYIRSNLPIFSKGLLPVDSLRAVMENTHQPVDPTNVYQHSQQIHEDRRTEWQSVLVERSNKAIYSLLTVNIAVYAWLSLRGYPNDPSILTQYGAKVNDLIAQGELWRLFMPMFLHVNVMHLLVNSVALLSLKEAERLYGSLRFLLIYLLAGIMGNLTSFAFSPNPTVGASGAIFGIFGALLWFGTRKRDLFKRTMGTAVWLTIIMNLILGFSIPQISQSGHIGGLVGGYIASAWIGLPSDSPSPLRRLIAATIYICSLITGYMIGMTFLS